MLARCWIDGAIDEVISKGSREPRPGGNSQTGGRDNQCDHVSHWCLLLRKHPRAGGRSVGDHVRGWCCWRMVLKMAWSFQSEGSLLGVGCHGAERDDMMIRAREIYKVTLADLQRDLRKNVLPIPTLILYQVMTSSTSTCKFFCMPDRRRSVHGGLAGSTVHRRSTTASVLEETLETRLMERVNRYP